MAFHTPHGQRAVPAAVELVELRLPDALPGALRADRRALRDRQGRGPDRQHRPHRPRRPDRAATSSTRSAGSGCSAARTSSRRTRRSREASKSTRTAIDRPRRLDRPQPRPLRLRVERARRRRAAHRRRLLRADPPRQGADARTSPPAWSATPSATRATGSRTSCAPRPRTGSSSPATAPATASRSRARASGRRSTSGSPPRARSSGARRRADARAGAAPLRARSAPGTRPPTRSPCSSSSAIPRLPPKVLTQLLRLMGRERPCRTAFGWYLTLAHPNFAIAQLSAEAAELMREPCPPLSSMPSPGSTPSRASPIVPRSSPSCAPRCRRPTAWPCCSSTSTTSRSSTTASVTRPATGC